MTREELAAFDGQDGRPAYVAVNGTIYDVTNSPRWENGLHPPDHKAGQDLTTEIQGAPHVKAVVERFPVIGTLSEDAEPQASGSSSILIVGVIVAVVLVVLALILVF